MYVWCVCCVYVFFVYVMRCVFCLRTYFCIVCLCSKCIVSKYMCVVVVVRMHCVCYVWLVCALKYICLKLMHSVDVCVCCVRNCSVFVGCISLLCTFVLNVV